MDIKDNYPFVKCLHPRKVYNKYTHKSFVTGCGCCEACMLNRTRKMSLQCSLEEQSYKYTMFVTCTFDNNSVPLAHVQPTYTEYKDNNGTFHRFQDGYLIINDTVRKGIHSPQKGDCLGYVPYSELQMTNLLQKFNLNGYVPYASLYDYQCFLKRFRKFLKKYTDEKIRFYGVSEYGPVHFRPHYHFLFFFNSEETFKAFSKCLRKAWTYGRVDASLSRSKCSAYVSGYVNSRCTLPRIFACRSLRPFSSHSNRFAQGFLQGKKAEIYENGPEYFSQLSSQIGSRYVSFMPWRSLASYYFPKCRKFAELNDSELCTAYSILLTARKEFGESLTLSQLAKCIADCGAFTFTTQYFDVLYRHFDDYRKDVAAIYTDLLLSRHFLYFVCDGDTSYHKITTMICKIKEYYKYVEYQQLIKWYECQEEYSKEYGPTGLVRFYDFAFGDDSNEFIKWLSTNTGYFDDDGVHYPLVADFSIENDIVYQSFRSDIHTQFNKSIKHKKLNDMNKIFNY